jgi:hypothetical protein
VAPIVSRAIVGGSGIAVGVRAVDPVATPPPKIEEAFAPTIRLLPSGKPTELFTMSTPDVTNVPPA